jgi:hypothetical protein
MVMLERPPPMRVWMTGADETLSSRMMAIFLPMFLPVISSKRLAPKRSNSTSTSGRFVVGFQYIDALVTDEPASSTARRR